MKIKIKDQEIELKQTFRTLMLYENIANETFHNTGNITNLILYFFCNVISSCDETDLTFEEFLSYLDEHNSVLTEYLEWLDKNNKIQDAFTIKNKDKKTEKKSKVK